MLTVINILAVFCISQIIIGYYIYEHMKRLQKEQMKYIYDVIKTINPNVPSPQVVENKVNKPLIRKKGRSYIPSKDIERIMGNKKEEFFD